MLKRVFYPQSIIKKEIKKKVTELCRNDWTIKAPRHSRLTINSNHSIINEIKDLEQNRADYRTAVHLITGKAGVNHVLHQMNLVQTKECPKCGDEDETVSHFLGQCPAYASIRANEFGDYYMSMTDIFRTQKLKKIIKYTNRTKRLKFDTTESRENGVT